MQYIKCINMLYNYILYNIYKIEYQYRMWQICKYISLCMTAHALLIIIKSGRKQQNKEKRNNIQLQMLLWNMNCRSSSGQTRLGVIAHKVDILTIFRSEMSCLLKYMSNKSCFCLPFSLKLSKPAVKRKNCQKLRAVVRLHV